MRDAKDAGEDKEGCSPSFLSLSLSFLLSVVRESAVNGDSNIIPVLFDYSRAVCMTTLGSPATAAIAKRDNIVVRAPHRPT